MSAANDGADASMNDEDQGVTSHGTCLAKHVIVGMEMLDGDEELWIPVVEVRESGNGDRDVGIRLQGQHWEPFNGMDWVDVRENDGHEYTDG